MKGWLAVALGLLSACGQSTPLPEGHTLFVGRVFDGTTTFDGVVEIDDAGMIVRVERERPSDTSGAIDLGDGTLLPGLIDLHSHITAAGGTVRTVPVEDHEPNLKALLRHGVTTFLHLGGMARVSFEIRRRQREGEILAPRMFSVGPFLDPPGSSHCGSGLQQLDHCVALPDPDSARTAVENLERLYQPDVLKITHDSGFPERPSNPFDDATLRALVDAAGDTEIVAHIRNVRDIDGAVAAGVGTITHLPFDERFSAADAAPWVAVGTRFIPTIALHRRELELVTGAFDGADPTLPHDVPQAVIDELTAFAPTEPAHVARVMEVHENVRHNFRSLLDAGATILLGSDAGIFGSFHGRSLIEEIEDMTAEGLPNEQALAGATSLAADLLGRSDLGRIAVGARADLLIVEGDPTVDITALRSIRSVYLDGVEVDREALEVDRGVPLEVDPDRQVDAEGTCLRTTECASTDTCTRLYRCAPRCTDSSECPAQMFCGSDIAGGRGCYPSLDCDPIAQNCSNGTACLPMGNGALWCATAGTAGPGEPCDGTSLRARCAPGARCASGVCEQLCALSGGACAAGQTCQTLEPETGVAVGACR